MNRGPGRSNSERNDKDERARERRNQPEAQPDELGNDPSQTGEESAGHGAELQQLSTIEDASDESVAELTSEEQDFEAEFVDGVEDAADHPERPTHSHEDYEHPDSIPPNEKDDEAA